MNDDRIKDIFCPCECGCPYRYWDIEECEYIYECPPNCVKILYLQVVASMDLKEESK